MRLLTTAIAIVLVGSASFVTAAAHAQEVHSSANRAVDQIATDFFTIVKSGKATEAVEAALGKSPLMTGKAAEKQSLAAQIDNALRIYGPILSFEQVDETSLGTLFVKRHYISMHSNMLVRWEFEFARLKDGWTVVYLGFEDQVRTWE